MKLKAMWFPSIEHVINHKVMSKNELASMINAMTSYKVVK